MDNKLYRNFTAQAEAEKWVSDITCIRTAKGWPYLTFILGLFDRKVIGWSQNSGMTAENRSLAAWKMAVKNNRPPSEKLLFHSERGI